MHKVRNIVIVTVTLNGQSKGEYYVQLTEDRDILMRIADIQEIGIETPEGHDYRNRQRVPYFPAINAWSAI